MHEFSVQGERVFGVDVDRETRCAHWHGPTDVIALKFKCCGRWYPCYECHTDVAGHPATQWPVSERSTEAILCGSCGTKLTIDEYFAASSICPKCNHAFNPGCAKHYDLYFEMD
ncbi:MAG: hypothetical protein H0V76_05015 [Blastocatellia bacterium]|nr:hypothetical protein [Blastocatellia bacterium]